MKVSDLIVYIDENFDNPHSSQAKITWINEIEEAVFKRVIKDIRELKVDLVKDQETYPLTTINFNQIVKVEISDIEYQKLRLDYHKPYSYYKSSDNVGINPVPSESLAEGMAIMYRYIPTKKTYANKDTDVLLLPSQIYEYYIYAKISFLLKEFTEGNNWMILYNQELKEYIKEYYEGVPKIAKEKINDKWR